MLSSGQVSCRYITWLFDFCDRESIDPVLFSTGLELDHRNLGKAGEFISWDDYVSLVSRANSYLPSRELIIAAGHCWYSDLLAPTTRVGHFLLPLPDLYVEMFGPNGLVTRALPLSSRVDVDANNDLRIELTLDDGCKPNTPAWQILADQMALLPETQSLPLASVNLTTSGAFAQFQVRYRIDDHWSTRLKRFFLSTWQAGQVGAELIRAYRKTQQVERELQSHREEAVRVKQSGALSAEMLAAYYQKTGDIFWRVDTHLNLTLETPLDEHCYPQTNINIFNHVARHSRKSLLEMAGLIKAGVKPSAGLIEFHSSDGRLLTLEVQVLTLNEHGCAGVAHDRSRTPAADRIEGVTSPADTVYKLMEQAVLFLTEDNRITQVNPAAESLLGQPASRLVNVHADKVLPAAIADAELQAFYDNAQTTGFLLFDAQVRRSHGLLNVRVKSIMQSRPSQKLLILEDMRRLAELEHELSSAQTQVESLQRIDLQGKATSGIIHDFNNLLSAIMGYAEQARRRPDADHIDKILEAGEQASAMTRNLLAFSRAEPAAAIHISVPRELGRIQSILTRLLPQGVALELTIDEGRTPVIFMSPTQFQQVIMNLVINARDAMPSGGTIAIKCDCLFQLDPVPDDYVRVTVHDEGVGIAANVLPRIFETQFTTKPEGAGTGLGLAMVNSLVTEAGGRTEVASQSGEGTAVSLFFPLIKDALDSADQDEKTEGGDETLLIIEEDRTYRELVKLVLSDAGYEVLEASHLESALGLAHEHDRIELILANEKIFLGNQQGQSIHELLTPSRHALVYTSAPRLPGNQPISIDQVSQVEKPDSGDKIRRVVRRHLDGIND